MNYTTQSGKSLKIGVIKGTVAPVWSRLKVVKINTVESGEVPQVVYRFFVSSINYNLK
jgi:hypothetical protein